MTDVPTPDMDDAERESQQVDAMKQRLADEARQWRSGRVEADAKDNSQLGVPVTHPPAVRARKTAPATPAKPASGEKKPFRMGYGGVTTAEHIKLMYDRGFR